MLTAVQAGYIVHQVNCRGAMGAGIAIKIANKWPAVKAAYQRRCTEASDPRELLGHIQVVPVSELLAVVNLFGQLNYGRDGRCYTDYAAVSSALAELAGLAIPGWPIFFPYGIGCGLAGGDWSRYSKLIEAAIPSAIIVRPM